MAIVTLIGGLLLMFGLFALAAWLWFADPVWGTEPLEAPHVMHAAPTSTPAAAPTSSPAAAPASSPVPSQVDGSTEIFDPSVFRTPPAPGDGGDTTQILSDTGLAGFAPRGE